MASPTLDKSISKRMETHHVRKLSSERLQPFNSPLMKAQPSSSSPIPRTFSRNSSIGQLNINQELFAGLPLRLSGAKDANTTTSVHRKSMEVSRKSLEVSRKSMEFTTESDEGQRNKIIAEIVNTERDYCKDLEFIVEKIMNPLSAKSILDKPTLGMIFSNIQEIRNINAALLQYLEQHSTPSVPGVCEIFSKMSAFFKCYSQYCNRHTQSLEIIQILKQEKPDFANFIKTIRAHSTFGLGLEDYLIKPIQRICKYPLFFNSLVQFTGSKSPDLPLLREASRKMQEVAQHVNEFRRIAENMCRVLEIQRCVHNKPFSLVQSSRRFLFEMQADVKFGDDQREWSTRILYLFNDMLMYTRPRSKFNKKNVYVGHIMLDTVDITDNGEVVRITKRDGGAECLIIQCRTAEDRAQWTSLTQRAIGDALKVKERIEGASRSTSPSPSPPPPTLLITPMLDSPQQQQQPTNTPTNNPKIPQLNPRHTISLTTGRQASTYQVQFSDIVNRRSTLRPTSNRYLATTPLSAIDWEQQQTPLTTADVSSSKPSL